MFNNASTNLLKLIGMFERQSVVTFTFQVIAMIKGNDYGKFFTMD